MKKRIETTYEFRPLYEGEMLRYNGGDWIPDDGEYDLAFVCVNDPVVYGVDMPSYDNIFWKWCNNMQWMAYVKGHPNGNAWHYMRYDNSKDRGRSWDRKNHPNIIAHDSGMDRVAKAMGCANGRSVDFNVTNDVIQAGLLRDADTKKIVKPPKTLKCCYCGEIDWAKTEKETTEFDIR